jgi:hypothetical protein
MQGFGEKSGNARHEIEKRVAHVRDPSKACMWLSDFRTSLNNLET